MKLKRLGVPPVLMILSWLTPRFCELFLFILSVTLFLLRSRFKLLISSIVALRLVILIPIIPRARRLKLNRRLFRRKGRDKSRRVTLLVWRDPLLKLSVLTIRLRTLRLFVNIQLRQLTSMVVRSGLPFLKTLRRRRLEKPQMKSTVILTHKIQFVSDSSNRLSFAVPIGFLSCVLSVSLNSFYLASGLPRVDRRGDRGSRGVERDGLKRFVGPGSVSLVVMVE